MSRAKLVYFVLYMCASVQSCAPVLVIHICVYISPRSFDRVVTGSSQRSEEPSTVKEGNNKEEPSSIERRYKEYICGDEALRISATEPYSVRRPIRRGHLNISLYYPMQQVLFSILLS